MSHASQAIASAIRNGDVNALSAVPSLRDHLSQPVYGKFTNKNLALTNPLPLQLAVLFDQRDLVDYIITSGASPDQVHTQSDSPPAIHIAVAMCSPRMIQLLAAKGASLESVNEANLTPLHAAVLAADPATFQTLVNLNAQVAALDPQGDTVIRSAIKNHKHEYYQLLAQNPKNLALVNGQGIPAFQLMPAPAYMPQPAQPQMVPVDAAQYEAMKQRVLRLEIALSQMTAARAAAVI